MKKKMTVTLVVLMLGICGTSISDAFSDLPTSHWAYEKVKLMQEKDIISGYEDGRFKPDKFITREQFATILSKTVDEAKITLPVNEEVKVKANNCTDIKGRWSYEYIDKVFNIMGHSYSLDYKLYFAPEQLISREEVAKILVKVMGLENEKVDYTVLNKFSDKKDISEELKKYVAIAVTTGMMNGNANGTFRPQSNLTRAQIAVLMSNLFNKENNEIKEEICEELFLIKKDGKYGYADENGNEIIACMYDYAKGFSEGLALVRKNMDDGQYSYIDKSGKEVISGAYGYADSFSDGLALVKRNWRDDKSIYIDKTGKEVISVVYFLSGSFSDGLALIKKTREDGKYGYMDKEGKEFIPCVYDDAWDFSEGVALVKSDNKYGYVDKNGMEIVPCIYDKKKIDGNFAILEKDGECWYINKKTKEMILWPYDSTVIIFDEQGYANVRKDGKAGIIDLDGNEVIPCKYEFVGDFSGGLAAVRFNDKWGYVDKTGKLVISHIYDSAEKFSEGLAAVDKNWKFGFIDKKGNEVIPLIYDYAWGFSEGLGIINKDQKVGYIDKTGNIKVYGIYNKIGNFSEGLAAVKKEDKYGYIDKEGNEIIPFIYDDANEFSDGEAFVMQEYRSFYIDKNGNEIE